MRKISTSEKQRIIYINHLMADINGKTDDIYEHMIDREFPECKKDCIALIRILKDIINSFEDD